MATKLVYERRSKGFTDPIGQKPRCGGSDYCGCNWCQHAIISGCVSLGCGCCTGKNAGLPFHR